MKAALACVAALVCGAAGAEPVVSIDLTLAMAEDYPAAVAAARDLGATATSLSLMWDESEPVGGAFAPRDDWPTMANGYFPTTGLTFSLNFSVIDTTADRRPADLQGLDWDDPVVIDRFIAHATAVLTRLPDVPLGSVTVGNEVDVALATPSEIAGYARFLRAVRPAIAALRPGVPFGTKLTFIGLTTRDLMPLIDAGDGVFATYYPLGAGFRLRPLAEVPGDIAALAAIAPGRPLWLMETGYPSDGCDAVPGGQAGFVETLFATAQKTPDLRLVSYTFLTDLPPATVDDLTRYYGVQDECFARYLATLGLRDPAGAAKPAAKVFRQLARP